MSFNSSVIPPTERSAKQIQAHVELYKKSLDTWRVYNPTDEDYICHWDRYGANEKWVVPNKNKDIGHGKGCADVPQYVMRNYLNQMGTAMIDKISREDWEKKKMEFRLEDRGQKEETLAIRTSDPKEWDKITPLLVKGIVARYGGDEIAEEVPEAKPEDRNRSMGESALERLGMADADVGTIDDAKENLINQIS